MLIWKMHLYLTCWDKLVLRLITSSWSSLILVVKIVQILSEVQEHIFYYYQGVPIYHGTHVPVTVAQSSAESEYNTACTTVINSAHFIMLIHELLNKYPDMVPEEAPLIVLDINYDLCMS